MPSTIPDRLFQRTPDNGGDIHARGSLLRTGTRGFPLLNALVFLLLTVSVFLSGCDFQAAGDAFDDFDIILELQDIDTIVALSIVDAGTDDLISKDVTISFQGTDAGTVVDMFSDPIREMHLSGGLGSFGITNTLAPSDGRPIEIRILAQTDGYDSGSATLELTRSGQSNVQIYLTKASGFLNGAFSAPTTSATVGPGGVVVEGLRLETGTSPEYGTSAAMQIDPGTIATTRSNTAARDRVQVDLAYYSGGTAAFARAFPGGFNTSVRDPNGTVTSASLTTVGFVSVRVTDATASTIELFDPPVAFELGVSSGTINPRTGAPVQTGDFVDVWSFDSDEGVWALEGQSVLEGSNAGGDFLVRFDAPHLSTWNIGWQASTCSTGIISVDRNGTAGRIVVHASSESVGWFRDYEVPESSDSVVLDGVPTGIRDLAVEFVLVDTKRIVLSGSPCGASAVVVMDPPSPDRVNVTFSLDFGPSCNALRLTQLPAFVLLYGRAGTTERILVEGGATFTTDSLGRINGGSLTISNLILGETYTFYTSVNGDVESRDLTIAGSSMVLDVSADVDRADLCTG